MRAKSRIKPSTIYEKAAFEHGHRVIVGIDEAGRGAWAGPVYAGAVCLTLSADALDSVARALDGVTDSKQLSARQRDNFCIPIHESVAAWGVGHASCDEIDALGIVPATKLAMQRALDSLTLTADYLLLDTMGWREYRGGARIQSIKYGDQQALSISAASILAKTARDAHMHTLAERYPLYGFAGHKGYGTAAHREALKAHGITPEHRRSFKPIRRLLEQKELL